jgi:hypothetical protein
MRDKAHGWDSLLMAVLLGVTIISKARGTNTRPNLTYRGLSSPLIAAMIDQPSRTDTSRSEGAL